MSALLAPEHVAALLVIAAATLALIAVARRGRFPEWCLKVLAVVLLLDEVSWWVYLLAGGAPGTVLAQSLPLQLCDVAIFIAAAALWTRRPLPVEVTYFWGLAGTIQALLTPDLPQHFPSYPYLQYYIAHGGVVASAFLLVVGLRVAPRPWGVVKVFGLTVAYTVLVGAVDFATGANYMYLRAKPPRPTLLDAIGPWPWYILWAALIGVVLFAVLDAPFWVRRPRSRSCLSCGPR